MINTMAQFTRLEGWQRKGSDGIVPFVVQPGIKAAKAVLIACYDGGSR